MTNELHEFMGKMVGDLGAAFNGALVLIGDKLGLYRALATDGPLTSAELARRTGTAERYVREWLSAQAASGYVNYDVAQEKFFMSQEQAMVFADEESPVYLMGGFYTVSSMFHTEPKLVDAFRSGEGVGWGEHHHNLFCGTAKFFRTTYNHFLLQEWIPALDGMQEKLARGGKVADVGCGHGVSTIIMAKAFPDAQFTGFDIHEASILAAREAAREADVENVSFEVGTAKNYPGKDYDLVACFDCLHDMGDPAGAAKHVHETLAKDGRWMIVEPIAGDSLTDNLNPVGRISYAASTMMCTPASLSQEVGLGLGAQAGQARLTEVIKSGGFSEVRRAAETPFNMVLEARP